MTAVRLDGIGKSFGDQRVLQDIDIDIRDREFMVFVGPSGCGKSTLLRVIAGLERASGGRIVIGDQDVTRLPPARRGVAMVFQSYALYPHMSVHDNIAFGLRVARLPADEIRRRTRETAAILQIEDLLERKPKALSGGQRQRVAIGRAIVRDPKVFLFDEPLSNLDAALRVQMRLELIRLHDRLDATMIYVTHDQTEAMTMANRIVVLNQGRIEQIGTPLDIYHFPRNLFVAGFIGSPKMNFLPATLTTADRDGASARLHAGAAVTVTVAAADLEPSAALTLGVRPEHVLPAGDAATTDASLAGEVLVVEQLGGETLVHLRLEDGSDLTMKTASERAIASGDRLTVALRRDHCHLFGPAGDALPRLDSAPAPRGETAALRE